LPALTPADGIVSFSVRDQDVDAAYYRAIGYPVYGPRAIRVDMLDRVVCAVYDSANQGKFKAQHKMAEWLGSTISDLYEVLSAMGHRKIFDPLEEKIKAESAVSENKETSLHDENVAVSSVQKVEEKGTEEAQPQKAEAARPELATFALKRGRASEKSAPKPKTASGERADNKKPFVKKPRPEKKREKPKKPERPREQSRERTHSIGPKPKPEDSPFAILQQLKLGSDDKKVS
jgi:ATP-dependent RNA helicase SUPV3L1/SUV3